MSDILEVRDDNFKEIVLDSNKLVMVDFWAEWCGPCKVILPIVQKINDNNLEESLLIVSINVDLCPETCSKYGIRAIPTLMLFKNGEPVNRITGVASERTIMERIDSFL